MGNWINSYNQTGFSPFDAYLRNELLGVYQGWLYFNSWNGGSYLPLEMICHFCYKVAYPNLSMRYSKNESLQPLYLLENILKCLHLEGSDLETDIFNSEIKHFKKLRWLILNNSDRSELDPSVFSSIPIVDISLINCNMGTTLIDNILIELDLYGRKKGNINLTNNTASASIASQDARNNLLEKGWILRL